MLGLHFLLHGSNVLISRVPQRRMFSAWSFKILPNFSLLHTQMMIFLESFQFALEFLNVFSLFLEEEINALLALSLISHTSYLLYELNRIHPIFLENVLRPVLKQRSYTLAFQESHILGLIFFIFQFSAIIFVSCVFYFQFSPQFCQHMLSEKNHGK